MFPSDKVTELLPGQEGTHLCVFGAFEQLGFPRLDRDGDGNQIDVSDPQGFAIRLVLEDSNKILYENRRMGRTLVKLLCEMHKTSDFPVGTYVDWAEFDNSLPDE
jgi:hypothetical protein